MSFVNLHGHSHYSLLDGYGAPKDIVARAKELGYPAVALTDHGVTYGLIELYNAAKAEGIKALLGCELYVARRTRFDKEPKIDVKPYHLPVIAETNEGYENLLKLVTQSHLEGFYYKPRVDYGLLKAHSKGLICLSGCIAGHLCQSILAGKMDEAEDVVKNHIEIFGANNYFLEIQDHPTFEQQVFVNEEIKKLSKKFKVPLVLTTDSHYPRPQDSDAHDVLLCIQTGTNVGEDDRMRYTSDFSLREVTDLEKAVEDVPEAMENTVKIAERCNIEFEFGKNLIPPFSTPQNEKPEEYLEKACRGGLEAHFGDKEIPKEYLERLDYELSIVNKMGFAPYFLIVADFVRFAREQDIVVGPGRGSAAGSIIAWSLGITKVDPLEYGLFFERFLNPERISMPDIDIDFADVRRDEVLNYVIKKYGRENVAQIITFGTMTAKAVVRDVGRALGYPYAEVDELAKLVPPPVLGKHTPLEISTKDDPDLRKEYEGNERAKNLLDYAMKLEGTVRHVGTHACAVVISEKNLTEYTALQFGAGGKDEVVTQYSANPLEALGLLKMDFLGLRNLTVIEKTVEIVEKTRGEQIDIENLPMDDEKTYKLFQDGLTTGVFQFESAGMKRYMKELKPNVFDDIVAMGALYRPGPMEWIPSYIKGKHKPKSVKYLHKSFEEVLANTYGVAVYQEQILQIARDFAGYTLGEADILRKAVGKKIPSLLAEQREKFVEGAVEQGHDKKFAIEVFEKVIEPFAGYGFNKAHAVCYGLIAYQTAYLKANYPIEFMTALLFSDANNTDRVVLEVKECAEMGIQVLPPSINESLEHFTVIDKDRIRFGLISIKGVGEGPIEVIVGERLKSGSFKSLEDFARRVPSKVLNKKVIQALAYSGALDEFGDRKQIAENYEEVSKYAKQCQDSVSQGQTDIFGMMVEDASNASELTLNPVEKSTRLQRLRWEKDFLGLYVSGHPLRGLTKYIARRGNLIGHLSEKKIGKVIKVCGLVTGMRKFMTKSGGYMATFTVEDPSGAVNVVMFPKTYNQFGSQLVEDSVMAFSGKFDFRRGVYQMVADTIKPLSLDTMIENAGNEGMFDPEEKTDIAIRMIDDILDEKANDEIEDVDIDEKLPTLFSIDIPDASDMEKLNKVRDVLLQNQGETPVEIRLKDDKKIKLPFGIELSDSLKEELDSILAKKA